MPVKSSSRSSYIYKKQRFSSLGAAESRMLSESDISSRLKLKERQTSGGEIVYLYAVPLEPYVYAGKDKTLIKLF